MKLAVGAAYLLTFKKIPRPFCACRGIFVNSIKLHCGSESSLLHEDNSCAHCQHSDDCEHCHGHIAGSGNFFGNTDEGEAGVRRSSWAGSDESLVKLNDSTVSEFNDSNDLVRAFKS